MTDMRDFTPSNDSSIGADSAFVDSGVSETKESYVLDDSGGLGEFHRRADLEEEGGSRGKAIGGVVIALMLGAAGVYAYSMWTPQTNDVVAAQSLPQTAAPQAEAVTPMTPPASVADTAAGDSMAMAPTDTPTSTPTRPQTAMSPPAAPELATPRATQQRTANAPRVIAPAPQAPAAMTAAPAPSPATPPAVTPPQQAAVPEPVSPTPPASAVAGNPPLSEQSAAPVDATPVTPTVPAEPAPAPQPEPAQPAAPLDQSQ